MDKLTISEALTTLEDGNWHSVAFVTADAFKKSGGKIIRIPKCRIHREKNTLQPAKSEPGTRVQRHSRHATRNLSLPNGMMRKIHIYMLFSVDQNRVL